MSHPRDNYKPGDRVRSTASVGPAGVGSVGTISKRYFPKASDKSIVVRWDDWDYDDGVGENHGDNGHWIGYESIELLQPPPTDEEIAELFGLASKPDRYKNLHDDEWMAQRIEKALDAIRHAEYAGLETELDLVAFAKDVLVHYAEGA